MAFTFGFYNSLEGDRKYNAMHFSQIFDGIINDGMFMSIGTCMMVKASEGMTVNVGIGRAWFNSTWSLNDAIMPMRLEASDLLLDRIDAVVLDVNANDNIRENSIQIVKGTAATDPQRPTLTNEGSHRQYPLAYIHVAASTSVITQANITNMVGTSECPFVTGILETISIDDLVAQWGQQWTEWKAAIEADNQAWSEAERKEFDDWCAQQQTDMTDWIDNYQSELELIQNGFVNFRTAAEGDFDAWFEAIKGHLSEDAAGNLQNQINDINQKDFEKYYTLVNRVVDVNRDIYGNVLSIVETSNEAVCTTTFEGASASKTVTTICVPVEGFYDYVRTVVFEVNGTGVKITESFTKTPKEV